jgi:methyl-accepting chemotaxis protein
MQREANDFDTDELDDFAFGERMINYIRWPLIAVFLLFNNLGLTENRSVVWPINALLLVAIVLTGYVEYRLRQGHSFGGRVTLAVAIIQDALITAGVSLTGLYYSHFFIFYYPSLLGLSVAFSLRTSLVYASAVGLVYSILSYLLTPGVNNEPLVIKVLIERWLVLYIIILMGWFLVRQERARRQEAVAAERQAAQENERLHQRLNEQVEKRRQAGYEIDQSTGQLATVAQGLTDLAKEMSSGCGEIETSAQELTARSATQVDQIATIGQITRQILTTARELNNNARPTGVASELAQHAVAQATEAVQALSQRSEAIGELAAAVRRVADQTNLLAFNANIEAIQAGQKGQRFAVVANEVRSVAERAIRLAREIDELSHEIQQGTRQVLGAMSEIGDMVGQTINLVQLISQTSTSQQTSTEAMAQSADTLKTVAQQNATDVQAVATAVHQQGAVLERIAMLSQELAGSANKLGVLTDALAS